MQIENNFVSGVPVRLLCVEPTSFYVNGVMLTQYFWQAAEVAVIITPSNKACTRPRLSLTQVDGLAERKNMKQTFTVVIDSEKEIEIGQIGVPIMSALKLDRVKVEKAAQPSEQGDRDCAHEWLASTLPGVLAVCLGNSILRKPKQMS